MNVGLLGKLVSQAIDTTPPGDVHGACCGDYAPYYHLVYLLAQYMMPCTIVELGVAYGRFLHCAALSSPANTVVGVDTVRYPELDGVLAECSNIMFISGSSVPIPSELIDLHQRVAFIDILHIDTTHTYYQAKAEFEAYKGLLADGAVVMFDDLMAAENDVLRFFDELPFPKIRDDRLHGALGYGVMVYESDH